MFIFDYCLLHNLFEGLKSHYFNCEVVCTCILFRNSRSPSKSPVKRRNVPKKPPKSGYEKDSVKITYFNTVKITETYFL